MNTEEHYWNTFIQINDWIKFADTKAGAIITLNSIIIGLIANNLRIIKWTVSQSNCLLILSILGSLSLLASIFFALICILPKLSVDEPESNIFFRHISKKYSSAKQFKEELNNSTNNLSDLKTQIWANSKVADNKFTTINSSIIAFSALLVFSILIIFILLYKYT